MHIPFDRTILNYLKTKNQNRSLAASKWTFSLLRRNMYFDELQDWRENYLPVSVVGKIVLDVGAGEGETAKLFLDNGAKEVICIEPDTASFNLLSFNASKHPGRLDIINRKFKLSDLILPFDFLKMDIEGYEEALLGVELRRQAVVEVHGLQLVKKFREKGYRIALPKDEVNRRVGCLAYAFWKC